MKQVLALFSILVFSGFAHAGMLLEPYLGYQMGKLEITGSPEAKVKGTALGGRVGYQFVIPWVALDVKLFKGKDDSTPEADVTHTDIGLTAGASVPFLRPFIGYVPKAKIKFDDGTGSDEFEGTALKLGLGIKLLPLVDINLEHTTYDIKELNGADLGSTSIDYTTTMIGVGITF